MLCFLGLYFCSFSLAREFLLFSCSAVSDSLWPHGLQHTRLPCPSPSPEVCSTSCPLSQQCHPTISSLEFLAIIYLDKFLTPSLSLLLLGLLYCIYFYTWYCPKGLKVYFFFFILFFFCFCLASLISLTLSSNSLTHSSAHLVYCWFLLVNFSLSCCKLHLCWVVLYIF